MKNNKKILISFISLFSILSLTSCSWFHSGPLNWWLIITQQGRDSFVGTAKNYGEEKVKEKNTIEKNETYKLNTKKQDFTISDVFEEEVAVHEDSYYNLLVGDNDGDFNYENSDSSSLSSISAFSYNHKNVYYNPSLYSSSLFDYYVALANKEQFAISKKFNVASLNENSIISSNETSLQFILNEYYLENRLSSGAHNNDYIWRNLSLNELISEKGSDIGNFDFFTLKAKEKILIKSISFDVISNLDKYTFLNEVSARINFFTCQEEDYYMKTTKKYAWSFFKRRWTMNAGCFYMNYDYSIDADMVSTISDNKYNLNDENKSYRANVKLTAGDNFYPVLEKDNKIKIELNGPALCSISNLKVDFDVIK